MLNATSNQVIYPLALLIGVVFSDAHTCGAQTTQLTIAVQSIASKANVGQITTYGIRRTNVGHLRQLLPATTTLTPIRFITGKTVRVADLKSKVKIIGTTQEYFNTDKLRIVRGRALNKRDSIDRNNVVVISSKSAKALFPIQDPIGQPLAVENEYFTIVGLFEDQKLTESSIVLPLTTMQSRFGDQVVTRHAGTYEVSSYEISELQIRCPPDRVDAVHTVVRQEFRNQQDIQIEKLR